MKKLKVTSLFVFLMMLIAGSCSKEPANPFEQSGPPDEQPKETPAVDSTSIAGLHARIFAPTCANSGCHDGTFEPDFRTINSTYNTLVYQPVIKNDPQGSFTYRVLPGQADQSVLLARMSYDIDGNSGVMPLVTEPDSDYPANRDRYIRWVNDWIKGGAKDINGNTTTLPDGLPQMQGVAAYSQVWLMRSEDQGSLLVEEGSSGLEIFLSLTDDQLEAGELGYNKIRFSKSKDGFQGEQELDLEVLDQAVSREGYWGITTSYYHKIVIDPADYGSRGDQVYFRVYITDHQHPMTEIPADGGAEEIKEYFSFTIVE